MYETEFLQAMQHQGYYPTDIVADGRIHRFATKDNGRDDAGWYKLEDNPNDPWGVFGDWRSCKKYTWRPTGETYAIRSLDEEKRKEIARIRSERAKQEERERETALIKANEYWGSAKPTNDHAYLVKKGIQGHGARVGEDGELLIPLSNVDGEAVTLQRIYTDDRGKKFWYGLPAAGGYFRFGEEPDTTLCICEGFATGATIFECTGLTTYATFSAANMGKVAKELKEVYPDVQFLICGDDDWKNEKNVGRDASLTIAAKTGGVSVLPIFSIAHRADNDTDFNDMARSEGRETVKKLFKLAASGRVVVDEQLDMENEEIKMELGLTRPPDYLLTIPGVLGEFVEWMNRTANVYQPQFAVNSALAMAGAALGRNWKTSRRNWANMYYLNVGPTGVGKEHIRYCILTAMSAAGLADRCPGGGYTSEGAVFSALYMDPAHVAVTDEFGMKQKSTDNKNNPHEQSAQRALMSAWGCADSILQASVYSQQHTKQKLTREQMREVQRRHSIFNPCLSMIGMTTGSSLYENLSSGHIRSGFLNRFIVTETAFPAVQNSNPENIPCPESVVDWIKTVSTAGPELNWGNTDPSIPANPNVIEFEPDAEELRIGFLRKIENIRQQMRDEGDEAEELLTRTAEMAQRVALIVALSSGRMGPVNGLGIDAMSMQWAIEYVEWYAMRLLAIAHLKIHDSGTQKIFSEFLEAFKKRGALGYTKSQMYSNKKLLIPMRQRNEILDMLIESRKLVMVHQPNLRGPATIVYYYRGFEPGGRLRTVATEEGLDMVDEDAMLDETGNP